MIKYTGVQEERAIWLTEQLSTIKNNVWQYIKDLFEVVDFLFSLRQKVTGAPASHKEHHAVKHDCFAHPQAIDKAQWLRI